MMVRRLYQTYYPQRKIPLPDYRTSVLIAIERGALGLEKLAAGRESEPFGISVVTVSELLHGVHRAVSRKGVSRGERLSKR